MTIALAADLVGDLTRIARVPRLLVAVDFDGTIAPLAPRPELAVPLPRAMHALRLLASVRDTEVAIISGRSLASLTSVGKFPPGYALVGSHGAEMPAELAHDRSPDEQQQEKLSLEVLKVMLTELASTVSGAWAEGKPYGWVLHTRQADPVEGVRLLDRAAREVRAVIPTVVEHPGKHILEFSVRDDNKGDALLTLRRRGRFDAVFYAGDDVTDEDAFAVLGAADLGVHTGGGPTEAEYSVDGPEEMANALVALALAREQ